jgi:hypothetical protein
VEQVKGVEGQTVLQQDQKTLDSQTYQLSTRNGAGSYLIPTEKEIVYLNYIPQKKLVFDSSIQEQLNPEFTYFLDEIIPEPDLFTLADGQIFRCASPNDTPQSKENYTYWIMVGDKKKRIPNYKTLEVILATQGKSLLSVRVITDEQCDQIPESMDTVADKTSSWTEDFKDQTNPEVLKEMGSQVKSGAAIADAATAAAGQQIAAVKAQAEQSKAEADAAKAKSIADAAAAQAAIAQAEAAKAQADQAKAEADAQKATSNK